MFLYTKGELHVNLKEQLRMRSLREGEDETKVRVILVGASQMGRLGDELQRKH